ncbi:hypothetical protein ACVWYN_002684 [Pedobacter sp. UYP24]
MKNKALKFIKEYIALIMAFVVFFISPYLLKMIDPTAGAYDAGVLQVIIMAIVQFAVFQAVTWSVVKNIWPAIGLYMKNFFNNEFLNLSSWQRICVSLFVYFSILAVLVTLSRVIQ